MRSVAIAVLLALLALPVTAWAAPRPDCAGAFLFRPDDRLSIRELSALAATADVGQGPSGWGLVARVTDWEAAPTRAGWMLLAVVYGGDADIGGTVVGGTLWVRRREAFGTGGGARFNRMAEGVALTFTPPTPLPGCREGFTFVLDAEGVLHARGKRVGRARRAE
jgi:hypothetical protein